MTATDVPRRPGSAWGVAAGLLCALVVVVVMATAFGSVRVPLTETVRVLAGLEPADPRWTIIVRDIRLPQVATAVLAGAALGVAGLQMQTLFRNALADPYILGASAGASLGVALVVLGAGSIGATFLGELAGLGRFSVVIAAASGSGLVLGLVLLLSRWVRSAVTLLLIGVMAGSLTSAAVSLLVVYSDPQAVQQFLIWGQGSFAATSWTDLRIAAPVVLVALLVGFVTVRSLNALLLGEEYARSMGVSVLRARVLTLLSAALLTGVVTAYCGPVGFVGLVVPHLARAAFGTANHRVLMPGVCVVGALLALACSVTASLPGSDAVLPVNAVTALVGAPVVITVLLRSRLGIGEAG